MNKEIEKAELIQSVAAYVIPSSLFIASLIMAAGTFLLYNSFTVGWALIAVSLSIMTGSFILFFRFHNKQRAAGMFPDSDEAESA